MKTAEEIIELAPCDLEKTANAMDNDERREIADQLSGIATRAAEFSAYFEERYGYGCGDQGHRKAVKQFNRVRKAVRKTLGFNITQPISF